MISDDVKRISRVWRLNDIFNKGYILPKEYSYEMYVTEMKKRNQKPHAEYLLLKEISQCLT